MNGTRKPWDVRSLGCSRAWLLPAWLLIALLAGATGCGDDDDGGSAGTGEPGGRGGSSGSGGRPGGRDGGPGGSIAPRPDGGHAGHDAGPRECVRQTDCPLPESECAAPICRAGRCGEAPLAAGKRVLGQTEGDCLEAVCDGKGAVMMRADDNDVSDDSEQCTLDACSAGAPTHTASSARSTCTQGSGKRCDGAGHCVECTLNGDCATNVCQDGACRPLPCANGVKDNDETDVDCGGGACTGCGPDKVCADADDCKGLSCSAGLTCVPNCADAVMNNDEVDVDCGPGCDGCGGGDSCTLDAHCADGFCHPTQHACATPTCGDHFQNQDETGEDCGGSCPPCATGCTLDSDCTSHICYGGNCFDSVNDCSPGTATSMSGAVSITFPNANSTYMPNCIKVPPGTTVTFSGGDFADHPLTGGIVVAGTAMPASSGPFTPAITSGTSVSRTLDTPGSYPFYCNVHGTSGMAGALFVVAP